MFRFHLSAVEKDFNFSDIRKNLLQIDIENKGALWAIKELEVEVHYIPLESLICHHKATLYHTQKVQKFLDSVRQKLT